MKKIILLLLFASCISFTSCEFVSNIFKKLSGDSDKKPVNVICFMDFSKSIPQSTLEWYRKIVKDNLINSLSNVDKITVMPIDYGSATSSSEIFSFNFALKSYEKPLTPMGQREKAEKDLFNSTKDSAKIKFDTNFVSAASERQKYNKGTDVLGALSLSSKYIDTNFHNLIVVFSDMIQETENLNLNKSFNNQNDISKIMSKIGNISLKNADLVVLTGEQPEVSVPEFAYVKSFWELYFKNNNINLIDYNSGSVSLLVNKINSYKR